MKYEKATAEVILFDNSDVITTSSEVDVNEGTYGGFGGDDGFNYPWGW